MPGPRPPAVALTDTERLELESLVRRGKTPQRLVRRASLILALADGSNTAQVARRLEVNHKTVRLWRGHWLSRPTAPILERLSDDERSGAPVTFSAEQWCGLTALACEPPSLSSRPISHWTARELADEAIKRGVVASISERHLGRFLKGDGPTASREQILAHPGT